MEPRVEPSTRPSARSASGATQAEGTAPTPPRVTFGQVEAALKAVPFDLLPTVYTYIVELLEDAEDAAILEARKNEPTQPADEFFAELDADAERAQADHIV